MFDILVTKCKRKKTLVLAYNKTVRSILNVFLYLLSQIIVPFTD